MCTFRNGFSSCSKIILNGCIVTSVMLTPMHLRADGVLIITLGGYFQTYPGGKKVGELTVAGGVSLLTHAGQQLFSSDTYQSKKEQE